ncbi:helix-turn-helix transcriptional regulator [Streptomyces sp. ESR1.13]|uniref:helix-turn-helix transcriptional regulator n=1 Tax=unclassified Streptomyces TaxID=2593676 RepID=UPI0040430CD1
MTQTKTLTVPRPRTGHGPDLTQTVVPPTVSFFPLTPSEQRVAECLMRGLTPGEIAAELQRSITTTHRLLRFLRYKTRCPTRCPLPVLAHRLLASGKAAAPDTSIPAPALEAGELKLLRALAEESTRSARACAAGLPLADLAAALDALVHKSGAANTTRLVVLGHSWKLLPTEQDHTRRKGASR